MRSENAVKAAQLWCASNAAKLAGLFQQISQPKTLERAELQRHVLQ